LVEKTTKKQLGGVTGKGFVPGKSGNPKGRPKGSSSIKDHLRRIGDEILEGSDMSKDEAIMRKVYKLAFEGQPWAVQFIADRKEGKPNQSIAYTEKKLEPLEGIVIE
jgi:hypothetical protein